MIAAIPDHSSETAPTVAGSLQILGELFELHSQDHSLLPQKMLEGAPDEDPERMVSDYIAGMTDRFALAIHGKLIGAHGRD